MNIVSEQFKFLEPKINSYISFAKLLDDVKVNYYNDHINKCDLFYFLSYPQKLYIQVDLYHRSNNICVEGYKYENNSYDMIEQFDLKNTDIENLFLKVEHYIKKL